jgi:peroxiredoxin
MAINVGDKAPDFILKTKTAEGLKDVKLSDNFGKRNTMLLFFPLAFTGVCTKEMCEVSAGLNGYLGLNAAVYGISVDSPFSQEAWAKAEKINVPLLSDFNKEACQKYGTLLPDLIGFKSVSSRAAFVVDKTGTVRYAEVLPDVKMLPNFEAVRKTLTELK